MEQSGKLILVTGFYGAGKSTLARAALSGIENLTYLKTTTTRPARPEETAQGSDEYDFVSRAEYDSRRRQSKNWDHMYLQGHSYGADVGKANDILMAGGSLICCVAPDEYILAQMNRLYAVQPVIIWVDTPLGIANERLLASGNKRRMARVGHELQGNANAGNIKRLSAVIFQPTFQLQRDKSAFINNIKQIKDRPLTDSSGPIGFQKSQSPARRKIS